TDFNNPDTDGDGLNDAMEITLALDPNDWDTDNDMLIDGVEMGGSDSTDGHLTDSDNDGLPDPWEDNDGDGILNIEEQDLVMWFWPWIVQFLQGFDPDPYLIYLLAYRFRINPNTNDTDGDDISDDKETQAYAPGPINKNSRSEYNYHQITNETGQGRWIPDRFNTEHDLSNPASGFSVWTEGRYSWWKYWFTKSYELGSLPLQTYNVVLYNMNPWLVWYILWDIYGRAMSAEEFAELFYNWNQPLSTYDGFVTYADCLSWQYRGKATTDPKLLRWNMYDTDPSSWQIQGVKPPGDDTDGDRMEDNWDPRPTIPDDRLDTAIALRRIGYPQPGGGLEWYYPAFGAGNQFPVSSLFAPTMNNLGNDGFFMHDYYGFPYRIIDSTMNKGMDLVMEIMIGIEKGHPMSEFFQRGFYNYLNVSITFHNGSIDVDPAVWGEGPTANVSYDIDDDVDGDGIPRVVDVNPMTGAWIYNPEESQYPMFALGLDDLNPENIPPAEDPLIFDEFNPADFTISGFGPWPGPDDPYYVEATGQRHDGYRLPFINVSNYPDPTALHFQGTNIWVYWSDMTFYTVRFHFMVPEGVMAGFVVMDMILDTEENIHVEESFDAFTGYPYIAY
ncbi:MAG: hypothetical protein ACMUIE_09200, partial [Thermoplasmatota archaeon]